MPEPDENPSGAVPLATMIETLRRELQVAQALGHGQDLSFEIDKVDLELKVTLSRKNKADGKIAFWVVTAGGGIERGGETAHTFKLSLIPKMRGGRLDVSSKTDQPPDER